MKLFFLLFLLTLMGLGLVGLVIISLPTATLEKLMKHREKQRSKE